MIEHRLIPTELQTGTYGVVIRIYSPVIFFYSTLAASSAGFFEKKMGGIQLDAEIPLDHLGILGIPHVMVSHGESRPRAAPSMTESIEDNAQSPNLTMQ